MAFRRDSSGRPFDLSLFRRVKTHSNQIADESCRIINISGRIGFQLRYFVRILPPKSTFAAKWPFAGIILVSKIHQSSLEMAAEEYICGKMATR